MVNDLLGKARPKLTYPDDFINKIICGDCLEVMKDIPDNSIDSVVTDPPYGWNFMGKKWDDDVPQIEHWKEALRILKHGGHALVCCGTRTQHRMAYNLEEAGFEIRDLVAWVYGSGFPKSLNIGKAVDKLQGNEREVVYKQLQYPDSDCWGIARKSGGKPKGNVTNFGGCEYLEGGIQKTTKGNSEWEGWGTALKPSLEIWTLCRKPLKEKTIAENVLKYGTGGINIDASRVELTNNDPNLRINPVKRGKQTGNTFQSIAEKRYEVPRTFNNTGRFPANLIHDGSEEVLELFPDNVGGQGGGCQGKIFGKGKESKFDGYKDSGSASRFFYVAKASKEERNYGLNGFVEKEVFRKGHGNQENDDVTKRFRTQMKNDHPTVKPLELMRYLCRLITPPKGIVLDPFFGSGTTGMACKKEGFKFIGIEKNPDYCKIAMARINYLPKRLDNILKEKRLE